MARLKTTYDKEIVAKLMSKLSLKNKNDVPKIYKIIFLLNNLVQVVLEVLLYRSDLPSAAIFWLV